MNTIRLSSALFFVASVNAALLLTTTSAHAGNKSCSPHQCAFRGGQTSTLATTWSTRSLDVWSTRTPPDGSALCVQSCVTILDRAPSHFRIYINDTNQSLNGDTGRLKCTLYSTSHWGNNWVDWQTVQSGKAQTGAMAFTFRNIDDTLNGGQSNESGFSAVCLIPPKWGNNYSYVGSIAVVETSATGDD